MEEHIDLLFCSLCRLFSVNSQMKYYVSSLATQKKVTFDTELWMNLFICAEKLFWTKAQKQFIFPSHAYTRQYVLKMQKPNSELFKKRFFDFKQWTRLDIADEVWKVNGIPTIIEAVCSGWVQGQIQKNTQQQFLRHVLHSLWLLLGYTLHRAPLMSRHSADILIPYMFCLVAVLTKKKQVTVLRDRVIAIGILKKKLYIMLPDIASFKL